MTKQQEIAKLDEMIAAFGPNSYLGPWLKENREQLVSDITLDLAPAAVMPSEANRQAIQILRDVDAERARLLEHTREVCRQLEKDTHSTLYAIRRETRKTLERMAESIHL